MRILILTLGNTLFLSAGTLFAASVWAPGVTETSGWYDVNKRSTSNNSTIDRNFCWAAVASNQLQWWCDRYEEAGYTVPDSITRKGSANYNCGIFENIFLKNWDPNKGADSSSVGLLWFFEGRTDKLTTSNTHPLADGPQKSGNFIGSISGVLDKFEAAYGTYRDKWDTLNTEIYSSAALAEEYVVSLGGNLYTWGNNRPKQGYSVGQVFGNYLTTLLKHGPVGLGFAVGYKGNGKNHEITVWGCEVGADGLVSKIYVTDSDNLTTEPLKVVLSEYLLSYDNQGYVSLDYNEAEVYGGNYITSLSGIMGYPIPEPSAFGLLAGLAALAFAGTRRSRRKFGK